MPFMIDHLLKFTSVYMIVSMILIFMVIFQPRLAQTTDLSNKFAQVLQV